ncbi:cystathionine gamma-lyase [Ahniella affigens]|uniref:Cystathionine gamma-lyase n=1 Tax=Ahniella affigens TaxID=2021234 RepID=A0A2P1PQU3_9GAMM|nr:cytochrome c [Ahniella affigens]AVP97205.1 cystathionine gamma-lyase [Ahniella affigens]
MSTLKTLLVLGALGAAGAAATIGFGWYNVAADDPHWPVTYRVIDLARARSISVRAEDIEVPDLRDPELIRSGAGNYSAMCVTCHLSPGAEETELSVGLYPKPPRWDALGQADPRAAFWVLKHGIKASGMPAWGKSMDDKYLWGMVAFIKQFPTMTAAQYREQIAASPGHDHGGGETDVGAGDPHAGSHSSPSSSFEPEADPMAGDDPVTDAHASSEGHDH